jgi:uncharacterized protein (TIGR02265 family)
MPEAPQVDASLFEGMFQRALTPDAALTADLRAVGFDPARIEGRYPIRVWLDSLNAARKRLYPGLSEEQGYRNLGRKFVDGYFETIIGRVVAVPLSLLGPDRMLPRLARSWRAARPDVTIDPPVEEAKQRWRVKFHDPWAIPAFQAGVVEAGGLRSNGGKPVHVEIQNASGAGFELVISW